MVEEKEQQFLRMRALVSHIHSILNNCEKTMSFAEIITAVETVYMDVCLQHGLLPELFEEDIKLALKHYKILYHKHTDSPEK